MLRGEEAFTLGRKEETHQGLHNIKYGCKDYIKRRTRNRFTVEVCVTYWVIDIILIQLMPVLRDLPSKEEPRD